MRTNRRAFTLIEVVVGIVLMASLVATTMVALASHQRTILLAKQRQQANRVAETLLTNWYELNGDIPTRAQGVVDAQAEWHWQTQPIGSTTLCGLTVNIVRLDVFGRVGLDSQPRILTSVELVQGLNASVLR
ncbi:MAG: type II secretion system protein [Pirellula sp.]